MTDKYSGQIVFAQMKTRQKGQWSEETEKKNNYIRKKQRLRNMAISTAAVFCLGTGIVYLAANRDTSTAVMTHVTTDFEYDETLGRLQFVSNMLPESAMVFLESSEDAISVFSPADEETGVVHVWSQQEPWVEYAMAGTVACCSDGDVMTVVKNHADAYTVRVIHENGYESIYSGLDEVAVSPYDRVFAGDRIGVSNGISAFELRKDGLSIRPQFETTDGDL